jgi:hypothetical protein
VQRIWDAHQLQPHRVRSFKRSRDQRFAEKMADTRRLPAGAGETKRRPAPRPTPSQETAGAGILRLAIWAFYGDALRLPRATRQKTYCDRMIASIITRRATSANISTSFGMAQFPRLLAP